jgi:hypothetical protein
MNLKHLDKRVVDHYVKDGRLTRKQYEDHLKKLPDVSHLVEDGHTLNIVLPSQLRKGTVESE